jgi:hypothetical protein
LQLEMDSTIISLQYCIAFKLLIEEGER